MLEKVAKIVELRQNGLTWYQVDQVVFPGTSKELSKKKSPSWHLCKKAGAAGEGAFSKSVWGWGTPVQIVTKLRTFDKSKAEAAYDAEILAALNELEIEAALNEMMAAA